MIFEPSLGSCSCVSFLFQNLGKNNIAPFSFHKFLNLFRKAIKRNGQGPWRRGCSAGEVPAWVRLGSPEVAPPPSCCTSLRAQEVPLPLPGCSSCLRLSAVPLADPFTPFLLMMTCQAVPERGGTLLAGPRPLPCGDAAG